MRNIYCHIQEMETNWKTEDASPQHRKQTSWGIAGKKKQSTPRKDRRLVKQSWLFLKGEEKTGWAVRKVKDNMNHKLKGGT